MIEHIEKKAREEGAMSETPDEYLLRNLWLHYRDNEEQYHGLIAQWAAECIEAKDARIAELEEQVQLMRAGLDSAAALIDESEGVYGLHLNGDPTPWSDLTPPGRFSEWLEVFYRAISETERPPWHTNPDSNRWLVLLHEFTMAHNEYEYWVRNLDGILFVRVSRRTEQKVWNCDRSYSPHEQRDPLVMMNGFIDQLEELVAVVREGEKLR